MIQGENDSLEDCERGFYLSHKRVNTFILDQEYLKLELLRGIATAYGYETQCYFLTIEQKLFVLS